MSAVLLLNANYEPLRILGLERAVGLLMNGRVEVIENRPRCMLRSPSTRLPMPSVLRLRYYVNVPRRHAAWTRRGVLARDGYRCVFCGVRMSPRDATIDHVIPQSLCRQRGMRPNTWGNTVCSCLGCQKRKGDRTMQEAGMRFYAPDCEPKTPRVNYLVLSSEVAPEWRAYLKL